MKKISYTLLTVFVGCFSVVQAQELPSGITIDSIHTHISGDSLALQFTVQASRLAIRCNGQLKVEFALETEDRRLLLPAVIYSGTQRYHYQQRSQTLAGTYYANPYHIYKGIKKTETYILHYKLSLPYHSWMAQAAITYREYTHDCSGDHLSAGDTLLASIIPSTAKEAEQELPAVWAPNSLLLSNLVCFLTPAVEEVKTRASMLSLNIGFPVNITEVRPEFGTNRQELQRADSLVQSLGNPLLNINSVSICGYASPEGRYAANDRLAQGRSQNFKKYLSAQYPQDTYLRDAHTTWVAEDWEGFGRLVEADESITQKEEVLAIVRDERIAPDAKDLKLQRIIWWSSNYKIILKEMYPKLRRIELRVNYTVKNLNDHEARELLYTRPELLSLEEIYRVARYYEPGSKQYREVYEIAARQYPNDVIANNNAAAALLREGNAAEALPYLEKTKDDPVSYINYGTYYYIIGDLEKAVAYFTKAKAAGVEQADKNLELINPVQ